MIGLYLTFIYTGYWICIGMVYMAQLVQQIIDIAILAYVPG